MSISIHELGIYSALSFSRIALAYMLSLVFSYFFGYLSAVNKRAEKIIIPIIDILQSIPILGFFPVAVIFFVSIFRASRIGVELAAVFLIFTSMSWNIFFAVYESIKKIPKELEELAAVFKLSSWLKLRHIYLPATFNSVVYNSIVSWANAWYFLIASEIIAVSSGEVSLPGLGSFLLSALSQGNNAGIIAGILAIAVIVLFLDFILWKPLSMLSEKYKYEFTKSSQSSEYFLFSEEEAEEEEESKEEAEEEKKEKIFSFAWLNVREYRKKLAKYVILLLRKAFIYPEKAMFYSFVFYERFKKEVNALMKVIGIVLAFLMFMKLFMSYSSVISLFQISKEELSLIVKLPDALVLSALRVFSAYLISLAMALPLSYFIANSERAYKLFMPLIEIFASIPAVAFYPVIVLFAIKYTGSLNLAAIVLIITGSLWYLIFNLAGAFKAIPDEFREVKTVFKIPRFAYLKNILLPGIFPSLITASIVAIGAAWNAIFVAEYITYKGAEYSAFGIGYLLSIYTFKIKNNKAVFYILATMVAFIIAFNRMVWKKLYEKATKYAYEVW